MDKQEQNKEYRSFKNLTVRGGWFPLLMGIGTLLAIFVPYIIAVIKKDFDPFLPIISEAAGYPPQSGVFAIILSLLPLPGSCYLLVNYADVKRKNENNHRFIDLCNKAALLSGFLTLIGLVITAAFQVGNIVDENWANAVLRPHLFGACCIIAGQYFHMGFMVLIMILTRKSWKLRTFITRGVICYFYYIACYIFVYPAYVCMSRLGNQEGMPKLLKEYDIYYLVSSSSEWALMILLAFYLWTYVADCHKYFLIFSVQRIESEKDSPDNNASSSVVRSDSNDCSITNGKQNGIQKEDPSKEKNTLETIDIKV